MKIFTNNARSDAPKVLIVGQFSFPTGSAAAARMRNLAHGFEESGAQVHLLPITGSAKNNAEDGVSRLSANITYELPASSGSNKQLPGRNLWYKKPFWFVSNYYRAWKIIRRASTIIRTDQCNLVVCYGNCGSQLIPIAKRCKQHGIPAILDVVELQSQFAGLGGVLNPIYWDWVYGESAMPKNFWGVSAITKLLAELYESKGCKRAIVVPSIEDWSIQCPERGERKPGPFRILTTSALIPRDAPSQIIELVRGLAEWKCEFEVTIVGKYEEYTLAQKPLSILKSDPVLRKHVRLAGRVTDEELARLRSGADCMLLTRRDSDTERFAFPTRLVEYLRSGRPVVASAVGEIPSYLRDGIDAILFDPKNPNSASPKICQLYEDKAFADRIGRSGFDRGMTCFDRRLHAKKLLDFTTCESEE